MTAEQIDPARPVVIVGFVGGAAAAAAEFQSPGSVVFVEEPDVVRKRDVHAKLAGEPLVRELIEWEHNLPGTADAFANTHPDLDPCAVVPLTEYAVPFAARLAERYGLPGAGYGAALVLRDKALLRAVTGAAGIANPASTTVHGPGDVLAFRRAHPGPVVLKPANRQASVGTQVIGADASAEDLATAWAACVAQDEGVFVADRAMELRMLAEEFVAGHEYSVEMLLRDGEPLFRNVTGKQLFPGPRPVEQAHIVPADIDRDLADLLGEQTRLVTAAVGFGSGIVHCEWIVRDGVPVLVECAGRFAGDGIIELIQRAYPVRLVRAYYEVMKGEPLSAPLPDSAQGGAVVRFLTVAPGVVTAVRGADAAGAADGVFACDVSIAPGDEFIGLRSSWDRVADVMVLAEGPARALALAEAAVSLIEVDVAPAESVPDTAAEPAVSMVAVAG